MANLLIANALIIPMTEERRSFTGSVRIRDGVITAVDADAAVRESTPNENVIDAKGCVLMPGLVNAHTHLYQVLLRAVWEDRQWIGRV